MVKDYPEDESLIVELKALIDAVNVLEVYEHRGFRTNFADYISK